MPTGDEFLQRLRATFRVEAEEHLQTIARSFQTLAQAQASERRKLVETAFRAAHSLKGAARAVDFTEIELLCQSLEDVFAEMKRQDRAPPPNASDVLYRTLDAMNTILAATAERGIPAHVDVSSLRYSLHALTASQAAPPTGIELLAAPVNTAAPISLLAPAKAAPSPAARTDDDQTVRISLAKLQARLTEAEELIAAKIAANQRVLEVRELGTQLEAWRVAYAAVESDAREMRRLHAPHVTDEAARPCDTALTRVLDFLDGSRNRLRSMESKTTAIGHAAQRDSHGVARLIDDLLLQSKELLLLPFGSIAASFPKLVRDQCRAQGKDAELHIHGEDVQIDRRILEEIKDALVHLLRNAVDHGVEPPKVRAIRGKPSRATITLAVTQIRADRVQILVSDDGAGVDADKIKDAAVHHGLLTAEEAARLDEQQAQNLIFESEVSSSPIITDISGRGLGLAIVREKAAKLGGEVGVESWLSVGATFRIVIPATRATFRGILVEAAQRLFVLPTQQVEHAARVTAADVRTVKGRDTIAHAGRAVPLVSLADVLEMPGPRPPLSDASKAVLILGNGDQCAGFCVDAVCDEMEVLVKPLQKPLVRVRNVAAVTILGSGRVAPILNVADLLKSARKVTAAPIAGPAASSEARCKRILLAEDSITSRMLLKGILETAGYDVQIAIDGMEAFGLLRTSDFDLLVSDVEMPRLNGFDLTARVRADKRLADLPVILVTALQQREDQERGIDVGANAYLIKSTFDQVNLLDAVRRLI